MIVNSWAVDWISGTFKDGINDAQCRDALSFGYPKKAWTMSDGKHGYTFMLQHPFSHIIMSNPERKDMGVHVQLGGRALKTIAEGGHSAITMLEWFMREGAKLSRLDLAVDVYDHPIDIIALAQTPRRKESPGTARKWSFLKGDDGGCTAYIGSRHSDKFLRIYDKAIESGNVGRPWTRFELEFKGDAARQTAIRFMATPEAERGAMIKGLMKGLFNPDDAFYQSLMDAESYHIPAAKNTEDNTVEWLLNSVAKTLAKTIIRRSDIDVAALFLDAVQANVIAFSPSD